MAMGALSARRPTTRRAPDVGAGDPALRRRGALARVVEPATRRAGPVTVLLKFTHLAAIAIWSAGLIVLPFLFWQRRALDVGTNLDRLHRMTRFVYVGIASPGAMVMLHVAAGLVLARLFLADGRFGRASYVALSSAYILLITAIIWIVLAKPQIDSNQFALDLFRP